MTTQTTLRRWVTAAALALTVLATSACSAATVDRTSPVTATSPPIEASTTRQVTDQAGTTVEIPDRPRIAARIGAYAQITAMVGGSEQLVATIPGLSEMYAKVWPKANPDHHDAGNIEEIIAAEADIVIGPTFTDEEKAQFTAAGVDPFVIDTFTSVDDMKAVVTLIADVVGGEAPEAATAFNTYYQGNISYVEERTADIPDADRVRLLNLRSGDGAYSTVAGTDISAAYAIAAGADFVSKDVKAQGISAAVDAEQIIAWDPQVIFTMGTMSRDGILADPSLATVPAVTDSKVYAEPAGTYPWSVRSAEGALMPLFLATILYPDRFADVSLAEKTREFYSTFYGYDLSDSEVEQILSGELW
ncbi:MAG: ABC transporter substrate-binding protein [Propioniciclava sp.]